RIDVRVARPGVKVRARNGYSLPHVKTKPPIQPPPDTPAVLAEMLQSPLPRPGLPMQMQAAAFAGDGIKGQAPGPLTIEIGGNGFKFTEKDGAFHDVLDLSILTVDVAGKTEARNQKVQLNLKPRTKQMVEATGFRVLTTLDLAAGRYQIRVAGRSANS